MKSTTYDESSGMPATPEKALCGSVSAKNGGAAIRVTFPYVVRAQPIVLTKYQIGELSEAVGRDVSAELQVMCRNQFDAKTLGQLMRLLRARLAANTN
jgi:hypothetical protein